MRPRQCAGVVSARHVCILRVQLSWDVEQSDQTAGDVYPFAWQGWTNWEVDATFGMYTYRSQSVFLSTKCALSYMLYMYMYILKP